MKYIIILAKESDKELSNYISKVISQADDNTEIILEKSTYFLNRPVIISDKHGFVFEGNGSIIVPEFHADKYYQESTDAFHITDSTDVTIRNFKICASEPANTAGRIIKTTPEYVEVELNPASAMMGRELCIGGMSYYEN